MGTCGYIQEIRNADWHTKEAAEAAKWGYGSRDEYAEE